MKVALSWLKEWISLSASAEEIESKLSNSGLEVEQVSHWSSVPRSLKSFVIGEVLTVAKHPNADKLSVTTVDVGEELPYPIVCGAPNVAPHQKVVVALPGAQVFVPGKGEFQIAETKIRGEISKGMICAEDEIGLGNSHDGIMVLPSDAVVGTPAESYFQIASDTVFEIGLTANRGDAASHKGVARDLSALFDISLNTQKVPMEKLPQAPVSINIQDASFCTAYHALLIQGVLVKESPEELKNKLKSIGIEPINNIVDATNFILHDCGQPLHAFDAQKIAGNQIQVRTAKSNETLVTLDKMERKLSENDLVIADQQQPIALAGVFGGLDSGVTLQTQDILLEAAVFHPSLVRKTARQHALSTDASFRFERGIDASQTLEAAYKCAQLIIKIAGGTLAGIASAENTASLPKEIDLAIDYLRKLAGTDIPVGSVQSILEKLGFEVKSLPGASGWKVTVPPHRNDVDGPADLVEEVLRIYGYDRIPFPGTMKLSLSSFQGITKYRSEETLRNILVAKGCTEVMNNSLTSAEFFPDVAEELQVKVANPLSKDLSILRPSLLPGLMQSLSFNLKRQQQNVKLFELGKIYRKSKDQYIEKPCLALVFCGNMYAESWEPVKQDADYYAVKSMVSTLIQSKKLGEQAWKSVKIGLAEPALSKMLDIELPVWYAHIFLDEWDALATKKSLTVVDPPKFPGMRRDLSIVVPQEMKFEKIKKAVESCKLSYLSDFKVFDIYQGKPLESNQKAVALSFFFVHPDRTLTEQDSEEWMNQLMRVLTSELGAYIRK